MADIGADRLRALRETVAGFTGDVLVDRQELLAILDAALDRGQAREELRAAAKMLDTHADKVPQALWALVSSMWQAEKAIYGHDAPPTDAEIAAHRGHWRCVVWRVPAMSRDALLGDAARMHREAVDAEGHDARWWALDTNDRPCSWPVALADEIGRERISFRVDDPSKDDTDEAHPAWWRGYNADKGELAQMADEANARAVHASALVILLKAERDEARTLLRSAESRAAALDAQLTARVREAIDDRRTTDARIASLLALMAGREDPPTDAEIAAHAEEGGCWRCVVSQSPSMSADGLRGRAAQAHRDTIIAAGFDSLWWALDSRAGVDQWPTAKNCNESKDVVR